jgi:hypothetical protein
MTDTYAEYEAHVLDDSHRFFVGRLPEELRPDADEFKVLWDLRPNDYLVIQMFGRRVKTALWQQAYGADYHYTVRTNAALPVPPMLEPLRSWARRVIDDRLNGLLLNWYDGTLGHSIGPHNDSTTNLVPGAPIVTISFGEGRIFRLSHTQQKVRRDFLAEAGFSSLRPPQSVSSHRGWIRVEASPRRHSRAASSP